ncbi:hypothetical protein PABG_00367 [Paracoccidioides brasiliensis Pb03]|nr:hypothetical protein PABG_00367 [Paracoccidioides brasiliensis Pb03]
MPNEPLRFEMSARTFRCGISISLKQQSLQDIYHRQEFYPFSSLPPSIVRSFYKKDAALYKHSGPCYEEVFEAQLIEFHKALVKALDGHEGSDADVGEKLGDTFRWVFVVVDKEDWEADGALVICLGENVAKLGIDCNNGEPVEGESHWIAYRMPSRP